MSEIREVKSALFAAASLIDETSQLAYAVSCGLDETRQQLFRVLADSEAPQVAHAHQVAAHAVECAAAIVHALQEAAAIARHRAATL